MKKIILPIFSVLFIFSIFSCKSFSALNSVKNDKTEISLIFAGDIMAHRPNFLMTNYDKIWEDIRELLLSADLCFANIEAPVCEKFPFSTYPDFNMQPSYPEAAIKAGFNVFSLVNNHTNDYGLTGMICTMDWAEHVESSSSLSPRPIYFSGINMEKDSSILYKIIECKGFRILFCAVTEITNRPDFRDYMNYIAYTEDGKKSFLQFIEKICAENPCDLTILSIHSDEPEYVQAIKEERKLYYHSLLEKGVDIIWANHTHVVREREIIGKKEENIFTKAVMYGNGNTISAQRWKPDFKNPKNEHDNTGDGLLFKIVLSKTEDKNTCITSFESIYITSYIDGTDIVIKKLNENFINELEDENNTKWASYIKSRKEITEKTKETIIWQ